MPRLAVRGRHILVRKPLYEDGGRCRGLMLSSAVVGRLPSGAGAGPGGAPAAAQRRGRPTWKREGPAAGWPAAAEECRDTNPVGIGRVDGEPRSSLYRLLGGRTRSDRRGFAPVAQFSGGPSMRPEVLRRLPERRAGRW